jgi:para-nitrobenzyl esterase
VTVELQQGAIVETAQGKVRGGIKDGIHFFKGMRYGGDTSGANRFMAPTPAPKWTGVQDAQQFGPRAPQETEAHARLAWRAWIRDLSSDSEDCLRVNVYTPAVNDGGKRPVMFYIHGGAFATGSGSTSALDGTHLARRGDVVVVTINHRLNIFGHLWLGAAGAFADAGNAGMLDVIAALQWVRDNIAGFGGDPGCVTVFGQSGGGSKVSMLMGMPAAKGLFHRAIAQSPATLQRGFMPDFAERMTARLFAALDVDRNDPAKLQALGMAQLMEGRRKAALTHGSLRPVVDGRHLPAHPFDPVASALSKDVPLMIGSTDTEATFYLTMDPSNLDMDEATAAKKMQEVLDADDEGCKRLLAEFRRRRPGATPYELLVAIQSRQCFRRNCIVVAERKAALAGPPTYVYEFAWESPVVVEGGYAMRSPHTICIPFAFGTIDAAAAMIGEGAGRRPLSEKMMDAWIAFARTGNPNHKGLPQWQPYAAGERSVMVFANDCRSEQDRGREDRLALDAYPPYTPEKGAARKR